MELFLLPMKKILVCTLVFCSFGLQQLCYYVACLSSNIWSSFYFTRKILMNTIEFMGIVSYGKFEYASYRSAKGKLVLPY
jgi:hypothetical protein